MTGQSDAGLLKGGRTLSVMPTYACPAQCKDCGTVSSPNDRNNITLETMLAAIDQAKELGFFNVVFTGGEATLRWEDLLQAISHANELDLPTRLVTNGHWASSKDTADHRVAELVDAGLKELNFSTGDEHARFIPVDFVVHGVLAALSYSLTIAIMIELKGDRNITEKTFLAHPKFKTLPASSREALKIIESPWMPLRPSTIETYPEGVAINRTNVASTGGCDSVLQTYVIQADGRVGACCGLGMRITPELNVGLTKGNRFLRDSIHAAEEDILKLLLHYKGPEKLLAWAAEKNPEIEWENLYAHKCQACLRIYKDPIVSRTVREHHSELIAEVLQAAWIEEEFYPAVAKTAAGNARAAEPAAA